MVRLYISISIPPKITDQQLGKYVLSYGLKYSGSRKTKDGKIIPFTEVHDPTSITPLSEFRKESNRIFTMNESHTLPKGLDRSMPYKITILNPTIGNVDDERNFTYNGKKGKTYSGIYDDRTSSVIPFTKGVKLIDIRRVFSPTDANELYLHADMTLVNEDTLPEVRLMNNRRHLDVVRYSGYGPMNINYLGISIVLIIIIGIIITIIILRKR